MVGLISNGIQLLKYLLLSIGKKKIMSYYKYLNFVMEEVNKYQFTKKSSKRKKGSINNTQSNEQKLQNPDIIRFKNLYVATKKATFFQNSIKKLYQRYYPLSLNDSKQLKEQWETKKFQFQQNLYNQLVQFETIVTLIYTIIILVSYLGILWYVSTYRLLQMVHDNESVPLLMLGLLVVLVDGGVKYYFKLYFQNQVVEQLSVVSQFRVQIYFIFYFTLNLILILNTSDLVANQICYIFDFIASLLSYNRTNHLWHYLKIITCTTNFKIKFKFFDLFGILLLLAHIFALLLYVASFYNTEQNWTIRIIQTQISNLDRYYYSMYFSFTTMLTIGYGDLVPMNKIEILAVLVVQVVGVAVFSYIINEIGFTIGILRKQEEHLQNNLSTLLKMSKFYRLQQDLVTVAKAHLVSNRKSINMIYPQDENKVLTQLNDDLRQTLLYQTGLSIIKNCSFFLCHWTKYFQVEISKKLIKRILHPFEIVNQLPRKQKMYIVKSGKLQIYTNRNFDFKGSCKKLLKTICPNPKNEVADNIFGYTSVMCMRPVKLNAISKDYTCVFTLSRQHFLSCVSENRLDQQYFFQIRDKIEQNKCVQAWQAPAVLNIREHYRPSELLLIKKHHKSQSIKRNHRKFKCRRKREHNKFHYENYEDVIALNYNIKMKSIKLLQSITERHAASVVLVQSQEVIDKFQFMEFQFQGVREYQKYFWKGNVSNVLKVRENRNYEIIKRENCVSFIPSPYFMQIKDKQA